MKLRIPFIVALTAAPVVPAAHAQEPPADDVAEVLISTTRNRKEANQDIPLPTSVVTAAELVRDNASTATDFARKLPNVSVIQNQPRQSSFSIRGIGKNQNQEAYEGSVGVIIDNVYTVHPGASWGNFFDLDRVEVARGPQGTLLGKNTTMGVVNIATKLPAFERSAGLELNYGERNTTRALGYLTGPLAGEWLAFRISGGYEHGDGPIDNLFRPGETLNDLNRYNGRVQFLVRPTATVQARLSADFSRSEEYNGAWYRNFRDVEAFTNGVQRGVIPPLGGATSGNFVYNYSVRAARFPGRILTVFEDDDAYAANEMGRLVSESRGASAQVDWEFGEGYTLTSISAHRDYLFRAKNDYDVLDTGFSGGHVNTSQTSQELRLISPLGERLDWQGGLYWLDVRTASSNRPGTNLGPDSGAWQAASARVAGRTYDIFTELNQTAVGRDLLVASLNGIEPDTLSKPTSESWAVYGQTNLHITDRLTLTTGARFTHEKRTNSTESWYTGGVPLTEANFPGSTALERQLATSLRNTNARTIPFIYGETEDDSVAWLVNPSFQLAPAVLLYASAAYGEKSSAVQFLRSGSEVDILEPERALNYELGVKSFLLGDALRLNVNLFHTTLRDFQTTVYVPDPTTTSGYASQYGNARRVVSKGVEWDIGLKLGAGWSVTATGAWNPARYADYPNGSCPVEVDPSTAPAGCDLTGQRVGGSSDLSTAIGLDYRTILPFRGIEGRAFVNHAYRSASNASPSLSILGRQGGYSVVDAGFGFEFGEGRHDLSFIAKNLFDKSYVISVSDFSNSNVARAAIGQRRYVGAVFRTRFGQ